MSIEIGSANLAIAVTPSDTVDLPNGKCHALWVSVGGTVTFANGGTNISITAPAGLVPISATRVLATGTAATGIVALY